MQRTQCIIIRSLLLAVAFCVMETVAARAATVPVVDIATASSGITEWSVIGVFSGDTPQKAINTDWLAAAASVSESASNEAICALIERTAPESDTSPNPRTGIHCAL